MYADYTYEEDVALSKMSNLNNFKLFMSSRGDINEFLQALNHKHGIQDMRYHANKYYKSGTIAHQFAKMNNAEFLNHPHLKHLQHVPDLKKQWLPTTYLSLHGNPIVKEMFKTKNKKTGLGDLDHYLLLKVFEFIGDSLWEETLMSVIPRVNKHFCTSVRYYRHKMGNIVRVHNGMPLVDFIHIEEDEMEEEILSKKTGKKRMKYEDQEYMYQTNAKKMKSNNK
jgi:hypothetical protein